MRYMRIADSLLQKMKNIMQLGGLQQLRREVSLENGVKITVMSIMGNDTVFIYAPPTMPTAVVQELESMGFTTEVDAETGAVFFSQIIADTAYAAAHGSFVHTVVKDPVPQLPAVALAGEYEAADRSHPKRPWVWSTMDGLNLVDPGTNISFNEGPANGGAILGLIKIRDSRYYMWGEVFRFPGSSLDYAYCQWAQRGGLQQRISDPLSYGPTSSEGVTSWVSGRDVGYTYKGLRYYAFTSHRNHIMSVGCVLAWPQEDYQPPDENTTISFSG